MNHQASGLARSTHLGNASTSPRWPKPAQAISLILLTCALALSACGKMGNPSPPGPADQVHYPKFYPTQ